MWILNKKPVPINRIREPTIHTIEGVIMECKDLVIPVLNIKCIYYSCLVESFTYGPMRKSRRMWYLVKYGEEIESFFIDDGTGRIMVIPEVKNIHIYHLPRDIIYSGTRRYTIYLLKPGD
jgi:hypothetical protein